MSHNPLGLGNLTTQDYLVFKSFDQNFVEFETEATDEETLWQSF